MNAFFSQPFCIIQSQMYFHLLRGLCRVPKMWIFLTRTLKKPFASSEALQYDFRASHNMWWWGKVCAFTSASCSINPVSLEKRLMHHLQLQKTALLRRHLPSSALILSLLSRPAHNDSDRRHTSSFFRRERTGGSVFGTGDATMCLVFWTKPCEPKSNKSRCLPLLRL